MSSPDEGYQIPDEMKVSGDTRWLNKSEWCQSVQARRTGAQTISNATETTVAFDNEDHDTNSLHDTVTNNGRLTCVVPGIYSIYGFVLWQASTVGRRVIRFKVNGATYIGQSIVHPVQTGDRTGHGVEVKWRLAAGDYVTMHVEQDSGGDLNVEGGAAASYFNMARVA